MAQIAQIQLFLLAHFDGGDRAGDLAGDEGLAADRALVIEQNAVRGVHGVGLAVVHRYPVGVELGGGVGRSRGKRRGLALRHLPDLAVEFGGRGLVEPGFARQAQQTDRLEQAQRADCIRVGGVFRRLEADLDMALGGEVVDLVRLGFLDDPDQVGRVRHVAVMQKQPRLGVVPVGVEVVDTLGVEAGRAALDAVDSIAFFQQEFGQIGAVLPGDPGDQSGLVRHWGSPGGQFDPGETSRARSRHRSCGG